MRKFLAFCLMMALAGLAVASINPDGTSTKAVTVRTTGSVSFHSKFTGFLQSVSDFWHISSHRLGLILMVR